MEDSTFTILLPDKIVANMDQECFDAGIPKSPGLCPVAKAMKVAMDELITHRKDQETFSYTISVTSQTVSVTIWSAPGINAINPVVGVYRTDFDTARWIRLYDESYEADPPGNLKLNPLGEFEVTFVQQNPFPKC